MPAVVQQQFQRGKRGALPGKAIRIDYEILAMLTKEARPFESYNDVLRRLLRLNRRGRVAKRDQTATNYFPQST
jgi:hypothetical protein